MLVNKIIWVTLVIFINDMIQARVFDMDYLKKIEDYYKNCVADYELIYNREFIEIYLDAEKHINEIFSLMINKNTNSLQKMICIYLLGKIPKDKYINFVREYFNHIKSSKLDENHVLESLISPGWVWNNALVVRYKNNEVRKLLNEISNYDNKLSETVSYILSGRMYENYILAHIDKRF
ncbi:MAG: hypothetical protein NZM04_01710 [Methylacidiphilales bacterium]|nr:hypothetical protein [Candidatus Methylacidiphilales bacterium]